MRKKENTEYNPMKHVIMYSSISVGNYVIRIFHRRVVSEIKNFVVIVTRGMLNFVWFSCFDLPNLSHGQHVTQGQFFSGD